MSATTSFQQNERAVSLASLNVDVIYYVLLKNLNTRPLNWDINGRFDKTWLPKKTGAKKTCGIK